MIMLARGNYDTMMKPQTWNDILRAMVDVRNAHGWSE